jgi:3-oxoacyl-[acyl-carrier protein] reductase
MKSLIVVGGSSGIGLETGKLLSGDYNIINMSRNKIEHNNIDNIPLDVSNIDNIISVFKQVKDSGLIPEGLIYASGFVEPQGLLEIDKKTLEYTFQVNLFGAIYCIQEYVKIVKKHGGKIILLSSTSSTRPSPGWLAYASSKAALNIIGTTLSEELREYKIKLYPLVLGRCATPLRKILAPTEDSSKIMQPIEVANFIQYIITTDGVLDGNIIRVR